jgi:glycosyltransferase involved in cell wall biosynthesis
MERDFRVSVIIPVYNRQVLGERALRSAVTQDVSGMEIVVVDDCSTPPFRLPENLKDHANINVIRLNPNQGESASRNAGVAAARGGWISFLDADDYWLPGTLAPRLSAAEQSFSLSNDPLTVHVGGFVVDNMRLGRREARMPVSSGDPKMFASGCWFCPGSTSLLRREVFAKVGPCDSALRRLQDLDWYLRLALCGGRVSAWNEFVAVVQTGPKSVIGPLETAIDHLEWKYASSSGPFQLPPALVRRLEAYFDVERASIAAAEKNWIDTAYFISRSLARVPRLTVHLERFWRRGPIDANLQLPHSARHSRG